MNNEASSSFFFKDCLSYIMQDAHGRCEILSSKELYVVIGGSQSRLIIALPASRMTTEARQPI
jgi:hypothetical protein